MYVTTPPARPGGQAGRPGRPGRISLGVARVEHQMFGEGGPFGWEDHIYFPDLMRSYGMECPPEAFTGRRNSFMDMTSAMVPRLHPYNDRFDVAVLSAVTPDSQPGFPMCHLSNFIPAAGLAFAVLDHGVVAPFTALHALASCVWADRATRALLMMVDQSTLLHDGPVPERLRAHRDSTVALVLDSNGELGTVHHPRSWSSRGSEVPSRLAATLREVATGGPVDTLICGTGLHDRLPSGQPVPELRWAPSGMPATGVWAVLAAHLPGWRRQGARVLVADFDEDQRRLSTCLVDVAPERVA